MKREQHSLAPELHTRWMERTKILRSSEAAQVSQELTTNLAVAGISAGA